MSSKTKRKEVDVTASFRPGFSIKDIRFTERQRDLNRLIRDENNKIIFIQGPAGTAKTFCATFCALMALRENSIDGIKYVRSIVESSESKIGFLPGSEAQKLEPYGSPLIEKLSEMLDKSVYERLINDDIIETIPTNFLRGRTFKKQYVLIDESQNISFRDLKTIISRIGEDAKFIFLGDSMQSDIRNSGFEKMIRLFNDDESKARGICNFQFTAEDVMRSEILKYIMGRLERQGA